MSKKTKVWFGIGFLAILSIGIISYKTKKLKIEWVLDGEDDFGENLCQNCKG